MENVVVNEYPPTPDKPEIVQPDDSQSTISNDEIIYQIMKNKVEELQKNTEFINSILRITAYRDHNKNIKREMRDRSLVLDKKYNFYTNTIDIVQISIIFLAALSAFIQASNNIFNIDDAIVSFITLIISSYTGLVLAVLKYKKYDEMKEGIHNLQQQFAEFLVEIECRDDKLNTWGYDKLWAGGHIQSMVEKWNRVDEELFDDLKPLIEKKQMLCCEFEKKMDTSTQGRLQVIARTDQLQIRRDKNNVRYQELQLLKKDIVLNELKKKISKKQRSHISGEQYVPSNTLFSSPRKASIPEDSLPDSLPDSLQDSISGSNIEVIIPPPSD